MKLLYDENISAKLVKLLINNFPNSSHIDLLGMQGESDTTIWNYAKDNDFIIVSKDNDFRQRAFISEPPPKIIWLEIGNSGTKEICHLIEENLDKINFFEKELDSSLLVLALTS